MVENSPCKAQQNNNWSETNQKEKGSSFTRIKVEGHCGELRMVFLTIRYHDSNTHPAPSDIRALVLMISQNYMHNTMFRKWKIAILISLWGGSEYGFKSQNYVN